MISEKDVAQATALLEARKVVRAALEAAKARPAEKATISVSMPSGVRSIAVRAVSVLIPLRGEIARLEVELNRLGVKLDEVLDEHPDTEAHP